MDFETKSGITEYMQVKATCSRTCCSYHETDSISSILHQLFFQSMIAHAVIAVTLNPVALHRLGQEK